MTGRATPTQQTLITQLADKVTQPHRVRLLALVHHTTHTMVLSRTHLLAHAPPLHAGSSLRAARR